MPRTDPKKPRKNTPRLRDGVMKRGNTWSYVIRVKDPETGISKPKWVGGFATEEEAKAARDQARVNARQGQYIDRNSITVATYLDQWLEAHAVEVKPKTLQDYRHLINRHVRRLSATYGSRASPRLASRSSTATWPPAVAGTARACPRAPSSMSMPCCERRSVTLWSLTKSFRPIQLSGPNGPGRRTPSLGKCGRPRSSEPSSTPPVNIGCSPFTAWPLIPAPGEASCSTSAGGTST
jgi:hypothetical protein